MGGDVNRAQAEQACQTRRDGSASRTVAPPGADGARARPPGPRGNALLGNVLEFKNDTIGAIVRGWRAHGDLVRFRGVGPFFPIYLVAHPDAIQHIMQDNFRNFRRPDFLNEKFRLVVGNGLVTSEGDDWARQRKLAQTAFTRDRLSAVAGAMTATTDEMLERWHGLAHRGEPIEVQSEMTHLIVAILTRTLFGSDMSAHAEAIERAVGVQAKYLNDRLNSPVDLPQNAPLPVQRRFLKARASLDALVDDLIVERRRSGCDEGTDLLSILLQARDEATGEPITDRQARDEIKTLLIAGHDTTSTTLAWAFYLLSKAPAVAERLRREVDEVLGDRAPTPEDIPNLKYTKMVLYETLRLYPPLWIVARTPIEDDEIAGYHVAAGSTVLISSYVTHRHPEFWPNPEGFEPERFAGGAWGDGRHRYAYIPFGGGARGCIGFPFAMMEMPLVLAQVVRAFRLDLAPGYPVVPESAIALRQKHGARMTLRAA